MALKHYNFSLQESNKLLRPCWIAGQRKCTVTHFSKGLALDEIRAVDVINCCKHITDLIEPNQDSERAVCKSNVRFSDIARLTLGISFIFTQQVSSLLNDTKRLLDEIKGTNLPFHDVVSLPSSPCASSIYARRKRKQVISRTVCVSTKRARFESPHLLDEDHLNFYSSMLRESQFWGNDNQQLNIKKSFLTTDKYISITEELVLTELDVNFVENDGFGELDQMDKASLVEFLPARNSLKRKSPDANISSDLCHKKPSLANISNNSIDLLEEIETIAVPPDQVSTPCRTSLNNLPLKRRNSRKFKLKMDKCIKLSRLEISEQRYKYYKEIQNTLAVPLKQKIVKQHINLLNRFKQSHLFPDIFKKRDQQSTEQREADCQSTIRSILDVDYSDALVSNILNFSQSPVARSKSPVNPALLFQELQSCSSNNNNNNGNDNDNFVQPFNSYKQNNFDSYSIMMDLLAIWRDNPDLKSIDANKFIKSFPDRFKAALAFLHLLSLSRDNFIRISNKLESLEIDTISLGPESIKLIDNVTAQSRI